MNIILPNIEYERLSLTEALEAIYMLPSCLALKHRDKLILGQNHLQHLEILRETYKLIAEWMRQKLLNDLGLRLELLSTKGKQIDLIEPFVSFYIAQRQIATTFVQRTGYSICPNFLWVHMIGSDLYRKMKSGGILQSLSKSTCTHDVIKTKAEDISICRKNISMLINALDGTNDKMPETKIGIELEDWIMGTDQIILCNSIIYARNNGDEEFYQEIRHFLKTARSFIQTISKKENAKEYQYIYSFIDGENYTTGKGKKPKFKKKKSVGF